MPPLLYRLFRHGRYEHLALETCRRFGCQGKEERLAQRLLQAVTEGKWAWHVPTYNTDGTPAQPRPVQVTTDDCFVLWLKNRLEEIGAFADQIGRMPIPDSPLTVTLHTGFLGVPPTAEGYANLARDVDRKAVAKHAQSKIFTTPLIVRPIDSVARQVAPEN